MYESDLLVKMTGTQPKYQAVLLQYLHMHGLDILLGIFYLNFSLMFTNGFSGL